MPIFPVRIDSQRNSPKQGFTFIEVTIALLVVCLLVSVTSSICLQALRLNRSGREMLLASLAMQEQTCRYLMRSIRDSSDIEQLKYTNTHAFITSTWEPYNKRWTICTLTADDRFDSLETCLALQYRK